MHKMDEAGMAMAMRRMFMAWLAPPPKKSRRTVTCGELTAVCEVTFPQPTRAWFASPEASPYLAKTGGDA